MHKFSLSPLNPDLTAALDTCGFSRLSKYPTVRIWRQINSRLGLLYQIEKSMNIFMQSKASIDYDALKFSSYFFTLSQHITYVKNCLAQLDINNTIDTLPTGDMSYTWEQHPDDALFNFEVLPFTPLVVHWRKYWATFPQKDLLALFSEWHTKLPGNFDDAAKLLVKATYAQRRSTIMSRLNWQLRCAHNDGWFMVFDTLTLSPDMVTSFYEKPTALRDYFRSVSHAVLKAEGRSTKDKSDDCYRYLCVPEYGTERGRLHFHCIHFLRTLPHGAVDPNYGRRNRNRRQVDFFRGLWSYGTTQPIAVRYSKDAFTRRGWLWPTDAMGKAIEAKPYQAIGFYITKYVCKNVDMCASNNLHRREDLKWHNKISTLIPPQLMKTFRVRMSRSFGECKLNMTKLSVPALLQLTQLHHSVTPYTQMLKRSSKKELVNRASLLTVSDIRAYISPMKNLLASLRAMMKVTPEFSLQSFMSSVTPTLSAEDISNEVASWLRSNSLDAATAHSERIQTRVVFGSK